MIFQKDFWKVKKTFFQKGFPVGLGAKPQYNEKEIPP